MSDSRNTYWNDTREGLRSLELRAAGFDPDVAAKRNAVVTVASPYTNAHRCNNRVQRIADILIEAIGDTEEGRDCWSACRLSPTR